MTSATNKHFIRKAIINRERDHISSQMNQLNQLEKIQRYVALKDYLDKHPHKLNNGNYKLTFDNLKDLTEKELKSLLGSSHAYIKFLKDMAQTKKVLVEALNVFANSETTLYKLFRLEAFEADHGLYASTDKEDSSNDLKSDDTLSWRAKIRHIPTPKSNKL